MGRTCFGDRRRRNKTIQSTAPDCQINFHTVLPLLNDFMESDFWQLPFGHQRLRANQHTSNTALTQFSEQTPLAYSQVRWKIFYK